MNRMESRRAEGTWASLCWGPGGGGDIGWQEVDSCVQERGQHEGMGTGSG